MKYDKNVKSVNRKAKSRGSYDYENDIITRNSATAYNSEELIREKTIKETVKRHKKRRRKNYILYYLLLAIILTVVAVSLSLTVFFNIEVIKVQGNQDIPVEDIIQSSGIKVGNNMLRLNLSSSKEKIVSENLSVDSVEIKRKLPNMIQINVKPAQIVAVGRFADRKYDISKAGRIIKITDKTQSEEEELSAPEFGGVDLSAYHLGDYIKDDSLPEFNVINKILDASDVNEMREYIKFIDISDIISIKIYYNNQYIIKVGNESDLEYKLKRAKEIITNELSENDKGVLDVSISSSTFFKPDTNVNTP